MTKRSTLVDYGTITNSFDNPRKADNFNSNLSLSLLDPLIRPSGPQIQLLQLQPRDFLISTHLDWTLDQDPLLAVGKHCFLFSFSVYRAILDYLSGPRIYFNPYTQSLGIC